MLTKMKYSLKEPIYFISVLMAGLFHRSQSPTHYITGKTCLSLEYLIDLIRLIQRRTYLKHRCCCCYKYI